MPRVNPDFARFAAEYGIHLDGAVDYLPEAYRRNYDMALDAQPALVTAPNSGIPAFLTTLVDPQIYEVLFAPNMFAEIFGEVKKGDWLMQTAMFPVIESIGEVSSYGDRNTNGIVTANVNFPQRQSYEYQIIMDWGQQELERMGLARIGWAAELKTAGVKSLNKYQNYTYAFGVRGLQNYGALNEPNLSAYLTPGPKAAGGTAWIVNGMPNAQANEIFSDIQSMFFELVSQAGGLVNRETPMTMALSPESEAALTATNTFNVNVSDLLKKNFPKLKIKSAVQYGANSAQNNQGITGGNVVQLIADEVEGQKTGFCAFNEKLRSFPVKVELSSFRQKMMQGTWGFVLRQPFGIAQMQGV
jgi:hypothetical protein